MRTWLILRTALLAFAFLSTGAARTGDRTADFTGKWHLNPEKSFFGALPSLKNLDDEIVQTPGELRIHRVQANDDRRVSTNVVYKLDGIDVVRKLNDGGESHTSARLEGMSLLLEIHITNTAMDMKLHDRWTLSRDGRTIEIVRTYGSSTGSVKQKMVLEKQ